MDRVIEGEMSGGGRWGGRATPECRWPSSPSIQLNGLFVEGEEGRRGGFCGGGCVVCGSGDLLLFYFERKKYLPLLSFCFNAKTKNKVFPLNRRPDAGISERDLRLGTKCCPLSAVRLDCPSLQCHHHLSNSIILIILCARACVWFYFLFSLKDIPVALRHSFQMCESL